MGNIRAIVLLAAVTLCLLIIGHLLALHSGVFIGAFLSLIMIMRAVFSSDRNNLFILHATKADAADAAHLTTLIQPLCAKANIPVPAMYVIETNAANLCAVGRNPKRASLAVTKGLMSALNNAELSAVLAQKISQISEQESFLGTTVTNISDTILQLADKQIWYAIAGETTPSKVNPTIWRCLAVISSFIIRSAIPKIREFDSDRLGAELCGDPQALASALEKLEDHKQTSAFDIVDARPAFASLFIVNPLIDAKISTQFARQPLTEQRVTQLVSMVEDEIVTPR